LLSEGSIIILVTSDFSTSLDLLSGALKKKLRQVLAIDSFFVNKDRVLFYTFGERNNANRGRKKIRWFFNREGSSPSIPNGKVEREKF
jgi:hypothetical protein